MFDLILEDGIIITPNTRYRASIAVQDGLIAAISMDLSSTPCKHRLDLKNQYILPGCIDSHMHLWENGFLANPDFSDSTRAALAGGVTTIIDHPLTLPEILDAPAFEKKVKLGQATSYTDFGLHAGVSSSNLDQLPALWQAGCTAFKIFMCESGTALGWLDSGEMRAAFEIIGKLGGLAILHAENQEILQYNRRRLESEQRCDPLAFVEWRPAEAEIEAIQRALYLLQDTGCRANILHITVPEGVELIRQARLQQNMPVWAETCPHNLYLTTDHLQEQGPWVTYAPPVREPERAERLWQQLTHGDILTMGSDHGPIDPQLKIAGKKDIFNGQFGIPGAETLVPLMVHAAASGRILLERIAAVLSENPARLYGLYPKKGCIQPGSDADFTIVSLDGSQTLSAKNMVTSCGWTPYEDWQLQGQVTHAILRGKIAMQNGEPLGKPGDGQFIRRSPESAAHLPR